MHQRKNVFLVLSVIFGLFLFGAGCSDNTIVTYVDSIDDSSVSQVELYFPLDEGYTTIYRVTSNYASDEIVTFQASEKVTIQGVEAVTWIGSSSNTLDTGYFYAGSNALYYYDDINSVPEKVLDFPLTIGNNWSTNDINTNDYTDIITGSKDGDGSGTTSKTFPTVTAINFSIDQIEQLVLNTGVSYSNAVRVSTYTNGKYNYYWYVQGIGLVRYVIGATTATYPDGDIVGELIEYGS